MCVYHDSLWWRTLDQGKYNTEFKKNTIVSRLTGCGAIRSLNLKRKSEEEVANKRNVSKSLVVVCLDPRLSSIDSIPPLLCASVTPYMLHL